MPPVKTLLIVWHSGTGGTEAMARTAAASAAREAGPTVAVRLLHARDAGPDDVLTCHGLILATPEYLGAMSGLAKDFLDRAYYPLLDRTNGLPWALMICAGSDGEGAVRQARRIATGLRWREVAEPLVVRTHAQTPERILAPKRLAPADLERCAELGAALAAGLSLGVF